MKFAYRFATGLFMICFMASTNVMADPPPGKGNPNKSNQGNNGQGKNQGQGNSVQDNAPGYGSDFTTNLVLAGITVLAARNLALNVGSVGYAPLPPGIAKNLARGKPLPPGIAKKAVPSSMLRQLPYHPGYEWQIAGSDLVLVAIGTAIVADVLRNVFD